MGLVNRLDMKFPSQKAAGAGLMITGGAMLTFGSIMFYDTLTKKSGKLIDSAMPYISSAIFTGLGGALIGCVYYQLQGR